MCKRPWPDYLPMMLRGGATLLLEPFFNKKITKAAV
jgi:hypothetical protein